VKTLYENDVKTNYKKQFADSNLLESILDEVLTEFI